MTRIDLLHELAAMRPVMRHLVETNSAQQRYIAELRLEIERQHEFIEQLGDRLLRASETFSRLAEKRK